jgi:hypothetical protein
MQKVLAFEKYDFLVIFYKLQKVFLKTSQKFLWLKKENSLWSDCHSFLVLLLISRLRIFNRYSVLPCTVLSPINHFVTHFLTPYKGILKGYCIQYFNVGARV